MNFMTLLELCEASNRSRRNTTKSQAQLQNLTLSADLHHQYDHCENLYLAQSSLGVVKLNHY